MTFLLLLRLLLLLTCDRVQSPADFPYCGHCVVIETDEGGGGLITAMQPSPSSNSTAAATSTTTSAAAGAYLSSH